jgi:hypothetical protein
MKSFYRALVMTALASPALAQNAPAHEPSVHVAYQKYSDLKWDKTNPELGADSPEISILHVNPRSKATELIIRTPKNFHVPRHWHTANETITVLHGTFIMEHEDSGNRVELDVGSFGYMPAKMIHQAWAGSGLWAGSRGSSVLHHRRRRLGHQLGGLRMVIIRSIEPQPRLRLVAAHGPRA